MKNVFFFALTLFSTFATSANNYPAPTDIVRAYFTELDRGNISEVEKLLADDFWANAPFAPQPLPKQAWIGVGQGFKAGFPSMKHEITSIIENGFSVAVRGIFKGKNDGPMMGNPATGNQISISFNTFFELDKSWKIKSISVEFDQKAFEAQLMAGLPNPEVLAELNIRSLLAAADEGNAEKFLSYWTPDGRNFFAGHETSMDDMKKRIVAFKTGFPDIKRTIDKIVVRGNTVCLRGWVTGTNTGTFRGQPATGNSIKVHWLGLYELNEQGKVTAGYAEFDTATLESQLKGSVASK